MAVKVRKKFLEAVDISIFRRIMKDCLNIGSEEVLIIGDYGKGENIISPIMTNGYSVAAKEMGLNYKTYFQESKIRGESADYVLRKRLEQLPNKSTIIINVSNRIGHLGEGSLSFRKFCRQKGHKYISGSSLGSLKAGMYKDVLKALDIDYAGMHSRALRIKKIFDEANELHVTAPGGTDVLYNVEGMKAVLNTGNYQDWGIGGNMPCGEVYIPCRKDRVEGVIVVDGSSRHKDGTIIVKEPIRMEIKKGSITSLKGGYEASLLEKSLKWAHMKSQYPWGVRRIGEFAVGLNKNARIIGALIVDEKALGTGHFAIGSNNWFGGSIYAIIHLDQVFYKPRIKADGKLVPV